MKSIALTVETRTRREVLDHTERIQESIPANANGICVLSLMRTTAALTLAALQDGAGQDLIGTLPKLVLSVAFRHAPAEHVPAHVLSAIIGNLQDESCSYRLLVADGPVKLSPDVLPHGAHLPGWHSTEAEAFLPE